MVDAVSEGKAVTVVPAERELSTQAQTMKGRQADALQRLADNAAELGLDY